jgi:hypothetical protein
VSSIPRILVESVVRRAGNRCEYCRLSQIGQEATFHIDHITPRAVAGATSFDNLALACVSCSLRKWAKQSATDPSSGEIASFYHPRTDAWSDHFRWDDALIVPLTPVGRTTVDALAMNRPMIVAIRLEEMLRGRHPRG